MQFGSHERKFIETRPHREAFKKDVQQTQVFNPFSEKLKGHDSQHGERGILRDVRVFLQKLSAHFVWRTKPKESYIAWTLLGVSK